VGAGRLIAATAVIALAAACAGPRIRVAGAAAEPSPQPGCTRVIATLVNASGGEGDVKVTARVRDRASGRAFSFTRSVSVRGHDTIDVVIDVPAPPGDYTPEVSAGFPAD
jgi:hypothetical protein